MAFSTGIAILSLEAISICTGALVALSIFSIAE